MKNLFGLDLAELESELSGEKKFRSKQIAEWIYLKNARDFESMSNLSKDLRLKLSENFSIDRAEMNRRINSLQNFYFDSAMELQLKPSQ